MYFPAAFLASLLVSANALATPHVGQGMLRRHQHAALAKVRAAAPEPVAQPFEASSVTPKRQLRKRCQPRKTSIAPSASSAASSSAASAPSSPAHPVNVAPPPIVSSSQAAPAPVATSSQAAPPPPSPPPPPPAPSPSPSPSPSPAPAPASPPSSGGSTQSSSPFTGTQLNGDGTFYATGLGACGITNNDSDLIAAVSEHLFDAFPGYNGVNPNSNPVCNRKVLVEFQGKQVTVAITDRCTACSEKDLDFSPSAFNQLADPSIGRIHGIQWTWL